MKRVKINQTNIANNYDLDHMFKRHKNYSTLQWIDVEDGKFIIYILIIEHFIVWMQMESFPDFQKLWGRLDHGLKKGKFNLIINNSKVNLIKIRLRRTPF